MGFDSKNAEATLRRCLSRLDGPEYRGPEVRAGVIADMHALGGERLRRLLLNLLNDGDPEVRCHACTASCEIGGANSVQDIVPLLSDPEAVVRWHACGCLHDVGDYRAIEPLIAVLKNDPDAQVRVTAAYSLGGIRSPAAIPALLDAFRTDHERDQLGYSPSFAAARALDEILDSDEIAFEGVYLAMYAQTQGLLTKIPSTASTEQSAYGPQNDEALKDTVAVLSQQAMSRYKQSLKDG